MRSLNMKILSLFFLIITCVWSQPSIWVDVNSESIGIQTKVLIPATDKDIYISIRGVSLTNVRGYQSRIWIDTSKFSLIACQSDFGLGREKNFLKTSGLQIQGLCQQSENNGILTDTIDLAYVLQGTGTQVVDGDGLLGVLVLKNKMSHDDSAKIKIVSTGISDADGLQISSIAQKQEGQIHVLFPKYTILAHAGKGGKITPDGLMGTTYGASQIFVISSDSNYNIKSVVVDGVDKGSIGSFTFTNITESHSISASFIGKPIHASVLGKFVDSASSFQDTLIHFGDTLKAKSKSRVGWAFDKWIISKGKGKIQDSLSSHLECIPFSDSIEIQGIYQLITSLNSPNNVNGAIQAQWSRNTIRIGSSDSQKINQIQEIQLFSIRGNLLKSWKQYSTSTSTNTITLEHPTSLQGVYQLIIKYKNRQDRVLVYKVGN